MYCGSNWVMPRAIILLGVCLFLLPLWYTLLRAEEASNEETHDAISDMNRADRRQNRKIKWQERCLDEDCTRCKPGFVSISGHGCLRLGDFPTPNDRGRRRKRPIQIPAPISKPE